MKSILKAAQYLFIAATATFLISFVSVAEANSPILERKDNNEWYIFIPSTIQVDDSEAYDMLRSQYGYWRDVQIEIQGLEGEAAALRAVEALNEMLALGIGFEMELRGGAYELQMYYHQNRGTGRSGVRLPSLLTDYNLHELLNLNPKVDDASSAAVTSLFFSGGGECGGCPSEDDWEEWYEYVREMLEFLCNSGTEPNCHPGWALLV